MCEARNVQVVSWKVNGKPLSLLHLNESDVDIESPYIDGNTYRDTLKIRAKVEFNETIVQCIALHGTEIIYSNNATLRIQGAQILFT